MAKRGSADVGFLLVDGYSILGSQTDITDKVELVTDEVTALGDAWQFHASAGIRKATFAQNGFFDDGALGNNLALVAMNGAQRVLNYAVAGNTIGRAFVGFVGALQATYERIATRGKLTLAKASYQSSGQVNTNGVILHALTGETATSGNTQASYADDNGAASTTGAVGYLQVSALALGGYTSVTVTLQDSADHVTFADISGAVFTTVTAAPAAQALVIAGTIRRYLAAKWAYVGSGSSPTVTFFAGLART